MKTKQNTSSGKRTIIAPSGIVLFIMILFWIFGGQKSFAQGVGISEASITPDPSAILELKYSSGTYKGFLPPRMTGLQRDGIVTPATGLIIFNTTTNKLNIYNGTLWVALFSGSSGVNSVSGTSDRISISGTSDLNVDIAGTYLGQTSITTLGTIGTGTWNGGIISGQYGGTGVANTGKTITIGGNFTTLGAFATTLTTTGITSVTLPVSGTLATLGGAETFTNKTLTTPVINGTITGTTVIPIANGGTGSATQNFVDLTTAQTIGGVKTFSLLPTFSSLTQGSIPFAGVSGALTQDNANLFWDNTAKRLGIGTNTLADPLTVLGDVKIGNATTGTIKSNLELVLRQDGDVYGPSILRLRNRNNENGAIFETTDPATTLVDFIFKTSTAQRNIRFEARAGAVKSGVPSFHIGGLVADNPTLSVGDNYSVFNKPLRIGSYISPTAWLHLPAGTATASTAPLKFTSGTLLTTTEAGAIEFNNDSYYATITTGAGTNPARKTFAFLQSPIFTTPNIGAATGTSLSLNGSTSGTAILTVSPVALTPTITLPTTSGTLALVPQIAQLTADVTNNTTTLTDVLGISNFSLAANSTYYFKFRCMVTSNATFTGIKLTVDASAGVTSINYINQYPTSATAFNYERVTALTGGTVPIGGPGAVLAEYTIEGTVVTSAAVTLTLQHRSETNNTTTIKAGSMGYLQKIQ